jgi:cytochrome c oxidase assembly protein subunit 15
MDFDEAFVMWRGLGVNYEFGVLEHPARTAIHVTHRVGALVTFLVIGGLVLGLLRARQGLTGAALLIGGLLLVQVALGIGNVLLHLPLGVATAHNGVAALLLVSLVYLNYRLWRQPY